ncbi:hypothetical protein ACN38_g8725 [Penicillium nordicum]|uniref:Major facilitator superfamily (MFS) profile domain-containing protein n=1 Tax=Penicillium nordicum TaxID=229535 RepID=A0A0N0RY81_9EURO|nr:hypothetical protein ACN38_g8725 [Penicillium nordicum]
MATSPSDSVMKMEDPNDQVSPPNWDIEQREPEKKRSGVLNVVVSVLALFSDGYNAQIIGYMEPLFSVLYMDGMSSTIKSHLSNSYLIGEIFGMLFFGVLIDRIGRRTGIVAATAFLIIGVVLATASHGISQLGYAYSNKSNS